MKHNLQRHLSVLNRRGTTMVELLVAFVIVMLVLVSFSKMVSVSVSFLSRSRQIIHDTEDFNERYYKLTAYGERKSVEEKLSLVLDEGKTDLARNHALSASIDLNTEGKLVCWKADDTGYKMYSLQGGVYASAEATPAPTVEPTPAPTPNPPGGGGPIDVLGDNIVGVHPIDFDATKDTYYENKVLPKGIYWEYLTDKDTGAFILDSDGNKIITYYVVTKDLTVPSYFYSYGGSASQLSLAKSLNEYTLSIFPIDLTKLYVEADLRHTDQDWLWYGDRPGRGSVYYYQGRYYVLQDGNCISSPTKEDGSINGGWNDITELVNVELKEGNSTHKDGDGLIVVKLNADGSFNNMSIECNSTCTYSEVYQKLLEEANKKDPEDRWAAFQTLPKGIYEINGKYYLVPADVDLNIYMMPETPVTSIDLGNGPVQYSRWIYKIDTSRLYTRADYQDGSYWWNNYSDAAENGMLYLDIQGEYYKYYYCLAKKDDKYENCSSDVSPSQNTEAWMDITQWVVTETAAE